MHCLTHIVRCKWKWCNTLGADDCPCPSAKCKSNPNLRTLRAFARTNHIARSRVQCWIHNMLNDFPLKSRSNITLCCTTTHIARHTQSSPQNRDATRRHRHQIWCFSWGSLAINFLFNLYWGVCAMRAHSCAYRSCSIYWNAPLRIVAHR